MTSRWTDNTNYDFGDVVANGSEQDILDFLLRFGCDQLPYDKSAFNDAAVLACLIHSETLCDKVQRYEFLKGLGLDTKKLKKKIPSSISIKNISAGLLDSLTHKVSDERILDFKAMTEMLLKDGFKIECEELSYNDWKTLVSYFADDLVFLEELHNEGVKFIPGQELDTEYSLSYMQSKVQNAWKCVIEGDEVDLAKKLVDLGYDVSLLGEIAIGTARGGFGIESEEMLNFLLDNSVCITRVGKACAKDALIAAAKRGITPDSAVFEVLDADIYKAFFDAGYPAAEVDITIARSAGRDDLVDLLAEYGANLSDFTQDLVEAIKVEGPVDTTLLKKALNGEIDVKWAEVIEALVYRVFSMRGREYRVIVSGKVSWLPIPSLFSSDEELLDVFRRSLEKLDEDLAFEYWYGLGRGWQKDYDAELIQMLDAKGAKISLEEFDLERAAIYCDTKIADAILATAGVKRSDLRFREVKIIGRYGEITATDFLFSSDNADAYEWLLANEPTLVPAPAAAFGMSCKKAESSRLVPWEWNIAKAVLESVEDGSLKDSRSASTNGHILCCVGNDEIIQLYGRKLQVTDALRQKLEADINKKIKKGVDALCLREPAHSELMTERKARLEKLMAAINAQTCADKPTEPVKSKAASKKLSITEATEIAKAAIARKESDALAVLAPFKGKIKVAKGTDLAMRVAAYGTPALMTEFAELAGAEWDKRKALCVSIRNGNLAVAECLIELGAEIWHVKDKRFEKKDEWQDPNRYFRNTIYTNCYNEVEHFFEKAAMSKDEDPGDECIDIAAARETLKALFEKGNLDWREAECFALAIFRQEREDTELFEFGKSLYENYLNESNDWFKDDVEACRRDSWARNMSLLDLLGREYTSEVLEDYIFATVDDRAIRDVFEARKINIIKRPSSLKKFIPRLTGEEIKTKTNMMKTLATAGYLDELKMMRDWSGAFTKKNIAETLEAAAGAGQVEVQAYLVEVSRELFGEDSGLEL